MDFDTEIGLHRILSGYYTIIVDNTEYKVLCPTIRLLNKAQRKYLETIEYNKFESSWLSSDIINYLLITNGLWNNQKENEYKNLEKSLQHLKKELYIKYIDPKFRSNIKQAISKTKSSISSLFSDKNYFYSLTLEAYAYSIKSEYIIANSVYTHNDELLFNKDLDNIELSLFYKVSDEINSNNMTMDYIKFLSRQDLWKSYWNCGKEQIFNNTSILDYTEEQRTLINLSKTYDAIREHPETPTEEIMEDDDAIEGWMIFQSDKIKKEKTKQSIESKYNIKNNADEVFIITQSQEQSNEIFSLNDDIARSKIKQMKQSAKQHGSVDWKDIPYVKDEIRQQATRK